MKTTYDLSANLTGKATKDLPISGKRISKGKRGKKKKTISQSSVQYSERCIFWYSKLDQSLVLILKLPKKKVQLGIFDSFHS